MQEYLQHLPSGYMILNSEGMMTEVNVTFANWLGKTTEQLVGQHIECILSISNKLMFHSYFYPSLQMAGFVEEMFIHFKHDLGYTVPMLLNAKMTGDEVLCSTMQMKRRFDYEMELRHIKEQMEKAFSEKDEALKKLELLHHEIEMKQEELIAMNASLLHMTNTDKLTGIYNRKFFQESLFDLMNQHQIKNKRFSLLLLDIDFFKKVNDTYGHGVGDLVLIQLAQLLKRCARAIDIVTRYGGEEFAILLPNTEEDEAFRLGQQLNLAVQQEEWKETGSLTVSVGVATIQKDDDERTIVEKSDKALYASKHNGRNCVTLYSEQLQ